MANVLDPFRFLLVSLAGWMNQRQLQITQATPLAVWWQAQGSLPL
jgi:hypothetical protein